VESACAMNHRSGWRLAKVRTMRPQSIDDEIPEIVTVQYAAKLTGLHENTIRKRLRTGAMKGRRADDGTGPWMLRKAHVEWVAVLERRKRHNEERPSE
jgi:hypothetical protein